MGSVPLPQYCCKKRYYSGYRTPVKENEQQGTSISEPRGQTLTDQQVTMAVGILTLPALWGMGRGDELFMFLESRPQAGLNIITPSFPLDSAYFPGSFRGYSLYTSQIRRESEDI